MEIITLLRLQSNGYQRPGRKDDKALKQAIDKMTMENDSLRNKLACFQLKYNASPHMKILCLDLIRWRVNMFVSKQQECQKRCCGRMDCRFVLQDTVFAKNYGEGLPWLWGTVMK